MNNEWKKVKLENVTTKLGDGLHGTPNYDEDGEYFFINGNNLVNGKVVFNKQTKKVSKGEYLKYGKELNDRTIFVSINGTLGNVAVYNNEKVVLGKSACYFNVLESIDKQFIKYVFNEKKFQDYIRVYSTGSTIKNMPLSAMRSFVFEIPTSLVLQQKIATILSNYDNLIENNEKRIEILENMAKLIYEEWFAKFRFPGHEKVKMIDSETEFGEIPEGWEMKSLNEFLNYDKGLGYKGKNVVPEGGVCFVNLKSFNRGGSFRYDGIKRYNGDHKEKHMVNVGDVIMAVTDMTQSREIVGRVVRIPNLNEEKMIISMDLIKLTPNEDIDKNWLYSFFRFSDFGDKIKHFANGANVLHLDPKVVLAQNSLLPPKKIRDKFSGDISKIFVILDNYQQKNQNLRKTRDLLLQKLISGEIDVSELEIQLNKNGNPI